MNLKDARLKKKQDKQKKNLNSTNIIGGVLLGM
jgi:hypothetical protein